MSTNSQQNQQSMESRTEVPRNCQHSKPIGGLKERPQSTEGGHVCLFLKEALKIVKIAVHGRPARKKEFAKART